MKPPTDKWDIVIKSYLLICGVIYWIWSYPLLYADVAQMIWKLYEAIPIFNLFAPIFAPVMSSLGFFVTSIAIGAILGGILAIIGLVLLAGVLMVLQAIWDFLEFLRNDSNRV